MHILVSPPIHPTIHNLYTIPVLFLHVCVTYLFGLEDASRSDHRFIHCSFFVIAVCRFPDFTSEGLLHQFICSVRKGKVGGDFIALVERALQAEASAKDNGN